MTDTAPTSRTAGKPGRAGTEVVAGGTGTLASTQGRTTIADTVVSKIAGIAAHEVTGVWALGGGAARAMGMMRDRIPGSRTNLSQGVSVEVGEKQAAVDIEIVAEYGVSIADLAQGIRRNVITAVERMTGLEVTEVNIAVNDIHLEGEDDTDTDSETEPVERRVQ
ncbi:Asp23/Gls24 family envelope stress response protein [Kribbella sp. CWNU-51]